jgi:LysR family transcriptional regulator, transcriptional activator of nhaA
LLRGETDHADDAQLAVHELDLVLSDFPMGPQFALNAFSHVLGERGVSVFAAPELARKYGRRFPQSLQGAPFLLPTDNTSLRRLNNQWFAMRYYVISPERKITNPAVTLMLLKRALTSSASEPRGEETLRW